MMFTSTNSHSRLAHRLQHAKMEKPKHLSTYYISITFVFFVSLLRPRQATLGWPITLVWVASALRSGFAGGRVRTPTAWRPPAWRWRKPGPLIWRRSCGIKQLTVEVVATTTYIFFNVALTKCSVYEMLHIPGKHIVNILPVPELRMQERVFMGMGCNPFMDIQPSDAAICDRAVNGVPSGRSKEMHTQQFPPSFQM